MDNVDQFFDMGITTNSSTTKVPSSTTKTLFTNNNTTTTTLTSSARKNKINVPEVIPEDIPEGNFDNYDDGNNNIGGNSYNDDEAVPDPNPEENSQRPPPMKQRKITNNTNKVTKISNKKGGSQHSNYSDYEDNTGNDEDTTVIRTAPKAKKNGRNSSSRASSDNDDEDIGFTRNYSKGNSKTSKGTKVRSTVIRSSNDNSEGSSFYSPGGTDNRRKRYSLGTGKNNDMNNDDDDDTGARRSNRRRWAPLQHWKNERIRYRENELLGVQEAVVAEKLGPLTPDVEAVGKRRSRSTENRNRSRSRSVSRHSKEKEKSSKHNRRSSSRDRESDSGGSDNERPSSSRSAVLNSALTGSKIDKNKLVKIPEVRALIEDAVYNASRGTTRQKPFSTSNLPSSVHESSSANIIVDGTDGQPTYQMTIIRRARTLNYEKLPDNSNEKNNLYPSNAMAAAAFDAPEYISGSVQLKPHTIKALESTTESVQIFTVLSAQPKSIEVHIGNQVYLVSPGDHFLVPRYCEYKLINHSSDTPAEFTFIVIRTPVTSSTSGKR